MTGVSRRLVLLGGAGVGAGLLWYLQENLPTVSVRESLLEAVGGGVLPREPGVTGAADAALVAQLWRLFGIVGARWEMTATIALDAQGFAAIIAAKTGLQPSYLTEYREGERTFAEVMDRSAAGPAGPDELFVMPGGLRALGVTRLGRLQKFVIAEFLELALAFGGFRSYGWRNYRGFAGGALAARAAPPYRTA